MRFHQQLLTSRTLRGPAADGVCLKATLSAPAMPLGLDPATSGLDRAELRGERVATAIGAAAEVGASRIIVTTWPNLDRAALPHVQDYARSERLVRKEGPS
jgi:hypothetical protein